MFLIFLDFRIFMIFLGSFWFLWITSKVTAKSDQGYYWKPKMCQNIITRSFFALRAKNTSAEASSRPV